MAEYQSNVTADEAVQILAAAKRVAITTHAKPDGDAYGSVAALAQTLRARGTEVTAMLIPPVPDGFAQLPGFDAVTVLDPDSEIVWPDVDLNVIVDTGAWSQIHPLRPHIESRLENTLIIDHHIMGGVPAKWLYIDRTAAACCEVIAEIIDLLGDGAQTVYDDAVANALFVGLASDTGWFRFSNTTPRTHELAARLIRQGVDQSSLYSQLEQSERVEKLHLMIRALDSLELVADQQAAIMVLRASDFTETGAHLEETERFVDAPQAVETVQVVVLITEPPQTKAGTPEGMIRLSFRSKPGHHAVNVADLAQQFGGGGHARAAGAKVDDTIDNVVTRVRDAIAASLATA